MGTRNFSAQLEDTSSAARTIDADAPMGFRLELVDVVFQLASNNFMNEARLYRTMVQSMGISGAPVSPMPDHRTGAARQIQTLEWMRVYDL
ncbi:MAG TPA: hypothetical protein VKX46_06005, partial [Ktedonobacteraceae bacterium]|nr:hypothetical protein [Ktedonobacteraceae bacterium]